MKRTEVVKERKVHICTKGNSDGCIRKGDLLYIEDNIIVLLGENGGMLLEDDLKDPAVTNFKSKLYYTEQLVRHYE